jgi:hypothetical protein
MSVRIQSLIIAALLSMFLWIATINCGVWLSLQLADRLASISTGCVMEDSGAPPGQCIR